MWSGRQKEKRKKAISLICMLTTTTFWFDREKEQKAEIPTNEAKKSSKTAKIPIEYTWKTTLHTAKLFSRLDRLFFPLCINFWQHEKNINTFCTVEMLRKGTADEKKINGMTINNAYVKKTSRSIECQHSHWFLFMLD